MLVPLLHSWVATSGQKIILGYFNARNKQDIIKNAPQVFEKHYQGIRDACAATPGRCLEMMIEDGWGPLCRFLGKEIPKVPFPRRNEIRALQAKTSAYRTKQFVKGLLSALGFVAVPFAVGVSAFWYMRR